MKMLGFTVKLNGQTLMTNLKTLQEAKDFCDRFHKGKSLTFLILWKAINEKNVPITGSEIYYSKEVKE